MRADRLNFAGRRLIKTTALLAVFLLLFNPFSLALAQEAKSADSAKEATLESAPFLDKQQSEVSNNNNIEQSALPKQTAEPLLQSAEDLKTAEQTAKPLGDESQNPALASASNGQSGAIITPDDTAPQKTILNIHPDKSTGALTYEYPIFAPPGRNGLGPDVRLKYNSQDTNNSSIVGFGWSLNIPYIQRENINGTNELYARRDFASSLSGSLAISGSASSSPQTYLAKTENGDFLSYRFNPAANTWTATDKKGTTYVFGETADARQDDPSNSSRVFRWQISSLTDRNGNNIKYTYFKDNGQIYPETIVYSGKGAEAGIYGIYFERTSQIRPDNLVSYAPGFKTQTNYLLSQIQVKYLNTTVRTYTLNYSTGANGMRQLLASIAESGFNPDSGSAVVLPPTRFSYGAGGKSTHSSVWIVPVGIDSRYTRVGDINGDGRADIVLSYHKYDVGDVKKVFINNGKGWTEDTNWSVPVVFYTIYGGSKAPHQAELVDVNGDGRADLISCHSNTTSARTFLSSGKGWDEATSWMTGPCMYPDPNKGGVSSSLGDLNGDGLVDYIIAWQSGEASISSALVAHGGVGWNALPSINPGPAPLPLVDDQNYDTGTRLFDVNNDGLADLVRHQTYNTLQNQPARRATYIHLGNGKWEEAPNLLSPQVFSDYKSTVLPSVVSFPAPVYDSDGDGFINYQDWSSSMYGTDVDGAAYWALGDFNADGLLDYISSAVSINGQGRQDLLKTVTNPAGGTSAVTYKPAGQYTNPDGSIASPNLPMPVYTAEKIITTDPVSGVSEERAYFYSGGRYFYNGPFDRQFGGFASVSETDAGGNKTVTAFLQADLSQNNYATSTPNNAYNPSQVLIGKIAKVENFSASGNLLKRTVNNWAYDILGEKRSFAKLVSTLEMDSEGGTEHIDKAESYSYDRATGNLTEKIQWGKVMGNETGGFADVGDDKFTTAISYAASSASVVIDSPSNVSVTNQSGAKIKQTKYYYDNLNLGDIGLGNLTKQEEWADGDKFIRKQKTYNSYGLATEEKDPRGKITSYAYDAHAMYPAVVANPAGHQTQYIYDYTNGKIKQLTDPNGSVFVNFYDGLGRILRVQQPDIASPPSLAVKTAYAYTDTTNAVSVRETNYLSSSLSVDNYTYFDGLLRPIQKRKSAENGFYQTLDFIYDNRGLLSKESLPYFSGGSGRTAPSADILLFNVHTYDALGRILASSNAVGITSNVYSPWKRTVTDPRGIAKDYYQDGYGNLIQVDEHNAGQTYSTRYEYDYSQNLTKITDGLGNARNFSYDGLGRRIAAEDLHAPGDNSFGSYAYAYDDSGNLIKKTDPKGQIINYGYDDLNRVVSEDFSGSSGVEASYEYDTCPNGKGRLCGSSNSDVSIKQTFDALGNIVLSASVINAKAYTTAYTYDRQGNRLTITNPDGSQIFYGYNSAGLMEMVSHQSAPASPAEIIASNFDYGPTEQAAKIEYGNGTITTNSYDADKLYQLTAKKTASRAPDIAAACYGAPQLARIGEAVTFTALASGGSPPYSYSWNGGTWGNGQTTVQTFDAEGIKTAELEVSDSSSPQKVQTASCSARVVPPPFSDDFANPDGSWAHNWDLYNGGGGFETSVPGVFRLRTGDRGYMQMKTKRLFYGEVDAAFEVLDQFGGATEVGLLNMTNNSWAARIILNAFPRFVTDLGDTGSGISGNYKGQWTKLRIATNGNEAKFYINDLFITSLPFIPGSVYRPAFLSNGGASFGEPHLTEATFVAISESSPPAAPPSLPAAGQVLQDLSYTYDQNGNITRLVDSSGTHTAKAVDYIYDDLNRLISASATGAAHGGDYTHTYTYDAVGNIISKTENGITTAYSYQGHQGSNYANPHAATAVGPAAYGYDKNGNLISEGDKTYAWDYGNRLTQTIIPSASGGQSTTTVSFLYDPFGQRVKYSAKGLSTFYPSKFYNVDDKGKTTKHIFAGDLMLATITPNSADDSAVSCSPPASGDWIITSSCTFSGTAKAPASVIVNAGKVLTLSLGSKLLIDFKKHKLLVKKTGGALIKKGAVLRQVKPSDGSGSGGGGSASGLYFHHTDHLLGQALSTDRAGNVVELTDYYPFGSIRLNEKTLPFSEQRKYIGQEYDQDTGLNYLNARYYNGNVGRFVSVDAVFWELPNQYLFDPQQWNSYSYARDNPLRYVDSTGLYNIQTGEVEKGDTQNSIVNAINFAFNINSNWETVYKVSFYKENFADKPLSDIVGQKLGIGTDVTVNITNQLNQLNKERAETASILGKGALINYAPSQAWDIKNSSDPVLGGGVKDRQYWSYIYNGELIRYDAPGNINFGYVARSLGLPSFVIKGGARAQQAVDDKLSGRPVSGSDNSGDSKYIQKGINIYKAQLSWWKRIWPW